MKITGIIQLKFKENVSEDIINKTITNIYLKNKDVIYGMEYIQFGTEEIGKQFYEKIQEWCT